MKNKKVYYNGKKYDKATVGLIHDLKKRPYDKHADLLKKYPTFKFVETGVSGGAYVGKKFVVKNPYICNPEDEPRKKLKCPTYKVKGASLVIQPKCKVFGDLPKSIKKKFEDKGIVEYCEGYYMLCDDKCGEDAHEDNFGILNGEIKVFDW